AELEERRRARWSADLEEARAFLRTLKAEGRELLDVVRRRPPDAARALTDFVRDREADLARRTEAIADATPATDRPPAIGDEVEVRGSSIRGELAEIAGDTARVRRGSVSFRVPIAQLRAVASAAKVAAARAAG